MIKGRVGDVQASCEQPKVHVLLDGKPWFNCPGNGKQRVLAGEHVIVAEDEAKDLVPESRRVVISGGNATTQKLTLRRFDSVELAYPYPRWIPYTIAGGERYVRARIFDTRGRTAWTPAVRVVPLVGQASASDPSAPPSHG